MEKMIYDLSNLNWTLKGFHPWEWRLNNSMEIGVELTGEYKVENAPVPGSVQKALLNAGIIKDWNYGHNAREIEWIENRHWVYEAELPKEYLETGRKIKLNCEGLDYSGFVYVNKKLVFEFNNTHKPYAVDITDFINKESKNSLMIVFTCSPRWLGQFGYTSEMREWKARFYYFWDWTCRVVQTGIWNNITLEAYDEEIEYLNIYTDLDDVVKGKIFIKGKVNASERARLEIRLSYKNNLILYKNYSAHDLFRYGIKFDNIDVKKWYPNNLGKQPLYNLEIILKNDKGEILDKETRKIGFKKIIWKQNKNAYEHADPWICHANGIAFFIQGINWTPIRPNFADVTEEHYRKILVQYKNMGVNLLRVWGGGFLEKKIFYDICDELGLLVWQEFPLSSSGLNNYPPDDPESIEVLIEIARTYITRRQHHACHAIWCGGNELMSAKSGENFWKPVTLNHPLMKRFKELTFSLDPEKRFLTSTPSGPSFGAEEKDYGKGLHWAVNGPWLPKGKLEEKWYRYWEKDDSLMRSETGSPGASPVYIIKKYSGDIDPFPCSKDNALWKRHSWWIEWEQFKAEFGRETENLEEYVKWSEERQSKALSHAVKCSKKRFPECGGIIIWMGHDSYPCTANTSIVDFEGNLKPSGKAVAEIFNKSQEQL